MKLLKPILLMLSSILISFSALADKLDCQLAENENNKSQVQNFQVISDSNPHGAMFVLNFKTFKSLTGFVSLLAKENKYFAVINFSSNELQIHSSGQYQMVEQDQFAGHQLIIPSQGDFLSSVQINCKYKK